MEKKTFSITVAKSAVKLDAKRTGEASFTVTNTSDKQATGQLKVRPMEAPSVIAAQSSWFAPLGDAKFPPQATTQVTAKFAVPANVPAGKYGFRLDAISASNPDDDLTEGPLVVVEAPAAEPLPQKPFPWWIPIAAGVAVLLVIGAVVWWLMRSGPAKETKPPASPSKAGGQEQPQQPAAAAAVWVPASNGGPVPPGAVIGGHEGPPGSEALYVCRASLHEGVHPGKFRAGFGGCNISWGGVENTVPNFELLTGQFTWASASNGVVPIGAIRGGQEALPGAEILYICRASYQNGLHIGKLRVAFGGCNVPWGGKEITVSQYEALTAR